MPVRMRAEVVLFGDCAVKEGPVFGRSDVRTGDKHRGRDSEAPQRVEDGAVPSPWWPPVKTRAIWFSARSPG
jgi:hypothetical protein